MTHAEEHARKIVSENARFLHNECYYVQYNGSIVRGKDIDDLIEKLIEKIELS